MSVGTLGGNVCSAMRLQIPAWGCWWLDATTVDAVELTAGARVTAELGGRTLQGTVVNGYARDGAAGYRVVGGAGGWGKPLGPKSYMNDAGVKLSTVIGDVAASVGETLSGVPATRLAAHFARAASDGKRPASWLLNFFFPRGWYVDDDGTTIIGQRSAAVYIGDGARTRIEPAGNMIELDIEALDNLAPGVSVDGSGPATDVEIELIGKRMRARVYAGVAGATNRRLAALAKIIHAELPDLRYRGCYEFRVVSQEGERFNLSPVLSGLGFADLERVPVRGPAGYRATVQAGELVVVSFVNASPDRPAIIGHDDPDAPGFVPTEITAEADTSFSLDAAAIAIGGASATLGVARMTDPVVAGPFSGTIVSASATVKAKS